MTHNNIYHCRNETEQKGDVSIPYTTASNNMQTTITTTHKKSHNFRWKKKNNARQRNNTFKQKGNDNKTIFHAHRAYLLKFVKPSCQLDLKEIKRKKRINTLVFQLLPHNPAIKKSRFSFPLFHLSFPLNYS